MSMRVMRILGEEGEMQEREGKRNFLHKKSLTMSRR
jgi:hypothetical protein